MVVVVARSDDVVVFNHLLLFYDCYFCRGTCNNMRDRSVPAGQLVANRVVNLPRQCKASHWDQPVRDPVNGNPYFVIKQMAPNPNGYTFWVSSTVPDQLWDIGIDIGESVPKQASPLDLVFTYVYERE